MKKLILAVMLSVLLCGFGTAYAVLGVNDDVPGQDVAFPIICEKGGGLDTLWAIAEKDDGGHFADSDNVVRAHLLVKDRLSEQVYDEYIYWTKWDIATDLCSGLISRVTDDLKPELEVTIGGKVYYVAYLEYHQDQDGTVGEPLPALEWFSNRFIPWVYLVDLNKGFASGFNGITAEYGLGQFLGEDAGLAPIAAVSFFPRFFFLNNNAETWNWWIFLAGRNELALLNSTAYGNVHRYLNGNICDEQENCVSIRIPIPYELNIINVMGVMPNSLKTVNNFPTNSLGGFALLDVLEQGQAFFGGIPFPINIIGTVNTPFVFSPLSPFYSMFGWSYQREGSNSAALSWDVIHPIHRLYVDLFGLGLTGLIPCNPNDPQCIEDKEIPLEYVTGDTTAQATYTTVD